ncbi:hypothetical protein MKZ24_12335 [Paenibacillus sp. FSL R7-0297]|uniref:hypothetical protein n=1 Tax=unclassified Paenibacillus TaxID=185978 RepID=UPI0004F78779|nr:hypothetical protein [Paenibacillus sp. FSL R5-0912]AIQ43163.1 hypothetical protein R50912_26360 [Paenibacillus sp. FSL R5-0912]
MTKRIQAYFSTEDAAEGAKTALIPYGVEGIEVSALTDPLDTGGNNRRNILMPLAPYNTSATAAGGVYAAGGATGPLTGAAIVPGVTVDDDLGRTDDERTAGEVHRDSDLTNSDLENLHYVMDLKVAENHYNEVVEVLRGKQAYVEIFD